MKAKLLFLMTLLEEKGWDDDNFNGFSCYAKEKES